MKYLLPPVLLIAGFYVTGGEFDYTFWYYVVPTVAWITLALWWPRRRPRSSVAKDLNEEEPE